MMSPLPMLSRRFSQVPLTTYAVSPVSPAEADLEDEDDEDFEEEEDFLYFA